MYRAHVGKGLVRICPVTGSTPSKYRCGGYHRSMTEQTAGHVLVAVFGNLVAEASSHDVVRQYAIFKRFGVVKVTVCHQRHLQLKLKGMNVT